MLKLLIASLRILPSLDKEFQSHKIFESHPHVGYTVGIFSTILSHCKVGHFSTTWLVFLENNWQGLYENFIAAECRLFWTRNYI